MFEDFNFFFFKLRHAKWNDVCRKCKYMILLTVLPPAGHLCIRQYSTVRFNYTWSLRTENKCADSIAE